RIIKIFRKNIVTKNIVTKNIVTDTSNPFFRFLNYLQYNNRNIIEENDVAYINILFNALKYGCLKMFDIDSDKILKIFIDILENDVMYRQMQQILVAICYHHLDDNKYLCAYQ